MTPAEPHAACDGAFPPLRRRSRGARAASCTLFALVAALALFGALSVMQKTVEKGGEIDRPISFRLPDQPAEPEKAKPPPRAEDVTPKRKIPEKERPLKPNASKKPARLDRAQRLALPGGPGRIVHASVLDCPAAFAQGSLASADPSQNESQAMSSLGLLLARSAAERAREIDGSRAAKGNQASRRGLRPAEPVSTPFEEKDYPPGMLDAGIECVAVVEVEVGKDGHAASIEVVDIRPSESDSGPGDFAKWKEAVAESVRKASMKWVFRAALDRSTNLPVDDTVVFNIHFEISS